MHNLNYYLQCFVFLPYTLQSLICHFYRTTTTCRRVLYATWLCGVWPTWSTVRPTTLSPAGLIYSLSSIWRLRTRCDFSLCSLSRFIFISILMSVYLYLSLSPSLSSSIYLSKHQAGRTNIFTVFHLVAADQL